MVARRKYPIDPPIDPMLAKLTDALPAGGSGEFLYEPKWDGFRAIVFRGKGEDLYIQSRTKRPLDRYFPELHASLLERLPEGCVVDGEIVIATDGGLDFDALQLRLHPAASRVEMLAEQAPSSFIAFDLLAADGEDVAQRADRAFADRTDDEDRLVGRAHVGVEPTEELQVTGGADADPVAAAVPAPAVAVHEHRCGLPRIVQVAAGQPGPGDLQLASLTRRAKTVLTHIGIDREQVNWRRLPARPLPTLDEVGDGLEFDAGGLLEDLPWDCHAAGLAPEGEDE